MRVFEKAVAKKRLQRARKVCRDMWYENVKAVVDKDRLKRGNPRPICISVSEAEWICSVLGGNSRC